MRWIWSKEKRKQKHRVEEYAVLATKIWMQELIFSPVIGSSCFTKIAMLMSSSFCRT